MSNPPTMMPPTRFVPPRRSSEPIYVPPASRRVEVSSDILPLEFLMQIANDTRQPMSRRVDCAKEALKYKYFTINQLRRAGLSEAEARAINLRGGR
jgi:hypothetical protein